MTQTTKLMKISIPIFSLLLFVFTINTVAQIQNRGIIFLEEQPFSKIQEIAKTNNKNIFVDCFATWCAPCKALSQKTFPMKEVGDYFNNQFVSIKYDVEKGNGIDFHNKYKDYIPGLPTMLLIDPSGKVIHSIVGFRTGKELITEAKKVSEGKTLSVLEKRYNLGERDLTLMKDYITTLKGAYQHKRAKEVVENYISNLPVESLLDKDIWSIAGEFISNPYGNDYKFVLKNLYKYEHLLKENTAALERQLSRSMRKAVEDIFPLASKENCQSGTLDSISVLREILNENILKKSRVWLAKLQIAEYMRNSNAQAISNFITFTNPINLFKKDYVFLQNIYSYLAENLDDIEMVRKCLQEITRLQDEENKSSLSFNFYDIISSLNKKLGFTKEAEVARIKYEELDKLNKEKVKRIYESFNKNE